MTTADKAISDLMRMLPPDLRQQVYDAVENYAGQYAVPQETKPRKKRWPAPVTYGPRGVSNPRKARRPARTGRLIFFTRLPKQTEEEGI
jgi:hypothetical protein